MKATLWALVWFFMIVNYQASAHSSSSQTSQTIHTNVRVKLTRLSFPLKITGTGISIKGIKNSDIQNVSIPKQNVIDVAIHKVAGKNLWFVQKGSDVNRLSQKYLEITSSEEQIRISGYKVTAPVLITTQGDIIASMALNTYLEGVLAGEMPTNWPIEALKAQAVAARSYTLHQVNQKKDKIYQLEGNILDQVFAATENSKQRGIIQQALEETEGLVLKTHGQVMKAYYHSDCGGKTEDPEKVWGGLEINSNSTPIVDAHCALNSANRWSYEISLDEMGKKIESSDQLEGVHVLSRTPSGRAALIGFNQRGLNQRGLKSTGKDIRLSGNELRKILGYNKLKSTLFTVIRQKDSIIFSGRGFGHGSGLCQWGARFMAEKGATVREILKHYYPSASFSEVENVADL